ncbi:hypothetical protein LMH87_006981 [Akanthomyces muscarius]|uniref:Uncharacterized protein n=1 Tax=Akanthomyces muscarius TaxID=2231603 RepID=A0A9W8QS77_AKAMU|nr:hypothetical protein LMH87_006981 [Akanthomyces muscarius]KAJ4165347.1 hypothetical protein LMH87_006981 [Akanthomyces muscarius]
MNSRMEHTPLTLHLQAHAALSTCKLQLQLDALGRLSADWAGRSLPLPTFRHHRRRPVPLVPMSLYEHD